MSKKNSGVFLTDSAHHEFLNWARWCWEGKLPHPMPPRRCGSIEGGYLIPDPFDQVDPPEVRIHANADRAKVVDEVFHSSSLPTRRVLVAHYTYPNRSGVDLHGAAGGARWLRMRLSVYAGHLRQAGAQVDRKFAR